MDNEELDELDEDAKWVSVSGNAYGAFIHVGLQSGVITCCSCCSGEQRATISVRLTFNLDMEHISSPTRNCDHVEEMIYFSTINCSGHVSMCGSAPVSGIWQAWRKCWTMLSVSIIIAVVFAGELIQRHQFFTERYSDKDGDFWVRERIHICWIPFKLQVVPTSRIGRVQSSVGTVLGRLWMLMHLRTKQTPNTHILHNSLSNYSYNKNRWQRQ